MKEGYIPEDFITDDYRGDNFMKMPQISVEELKGLQRTFPLYVNFPKIIWPIIRIAEQNNMVFKILSKTFVRIKWGSKKNNI